jgi:hypothetical protein
LYGLTLQALRKQHLERAPADLAFENGVWERLKALLVRQLGLRPEQVVPSARFFHELGFD